MHPHITILNMPREKTYGEIAYRTFCGLDTTLSQPEDFEVLTDQMQMRWENTAGAVLAEYHKRQAALSRQTKPNATT
jgi:hypothetical protein